MPLTEEELKQANERLAKAKKILPPHVVQTKIAEIYAGASDEQLSALGIQKTTAPVNAPNPFTSPKSNLKKLEESDFKKPYGELRSRLTKLTPQEIIEGDFLSSASGYRNSEVVIKLLQQFVIPPKDAPKLSEEERQAALEAGFLKLLEAAHSIRTEHNSLLEVAKANKIRIESENARIDSLDNIQDINDKINELKLERTKLDGLILEVNNREDLLFGQKAQMIKEASIKFIKDSREKITEEVQQKYSESERVNKKNLKYLGDAIEKYGTAGVNFESPKIVSALNEQTGLLRGVSAEMMSTRTSVKQFIASAKSSQKNLSSKGKAASQKTKKVTNLADSPRELSASANQAIKRFSNSSGEKKATRKAEMLEVVLFELGSRSAKLKLMRDRLPEGNLKSNLDTYIVEANEYHIYRALGLKEGKEPEMPMQIDKDTVVKELDKLVAYEIRVSPQVDVGQEDVEEEVKKVLQEMGLSSKVTTLPENFLVEEQEELEPEKEQNQEEGALKNQESSLEKVGFTKDSFAEVLTFYQSLPDKSKIGMLLKTRFQISPDKVEAAKALLEQESKSSKLKAVSIPKKAETGPLSASDFEKPYSEIKNRLIKLTPQEIIEGNFLSSAADYNNAEAVTKLLQQFSIPPKGTPELQEADKQAALEVGFLKLLGAANSIRTKYSSLLEAAKTAKVKVESENYQIDSLDNIQDINTKINELELGRADLDRSIHKIKSRKDLLAAQKEQKIKEASIKLIKDSREELTKGVDQEYSKLERANKKALKDLGEAIGKYGTSGVNFESPNIVSALNEQTGLLKGGSTKIIDTRMEVKKFIVSAKDLQKKFSSKGKSVSRKSKKQTNLADPPPKLSDRTEEAIKKFHSYSEDAPKTDKEITKEATKALMVEAILFDLGSRAAKLKVMRDKLPNGELRSNLDLYIAEASEYHIYRGLGLKEGDEPKIPMQIDRGNIIKELNKLVEQEVESLPPVDIGQEEVEEEVKKILQELGVSSKVTNLSGNDLELAEVPEKEKAQVQGEAQVVVSEQEKKGSEIQGKAQVITEKPRNDRLQVQEEAQVVVSEQEKKGSEIQGRAQVMTEKPKSDRLQVQEEAEVVISGQEKQKLQTREEFRVITEGQDKVQNQEVGQAVTSLNATGNHRVRESTKKHKVNFQPLSAIRANKAVSSVKNEMVNKKAPYRIIVDSASNKERDYDDSKFKIALENFMIEIDRERKKNPDFLETRNNQSDIQKYESLISKFMQESGLDASKRGKVEPVLNDAAKNIPQAGFKAWLNKVSNEIKNNLGLRLKRVKSQDTRIKQYVSKDVVMALRRGLNKPSSMLVDGRSFTNANRVKGPLGRTQ